MILLRVVTIGSSSVKVNGISVHRKGDATIGHGSWVNKSASGSPNVFWRIEMALCGKNDALTIVTDKIADIEKEITAKLGLIVKRLQVH